MALYYILEGTIDINPQDYAIERNEFEIVKLLVENGADISVEREGKSLINIAEESGFKDIIEYLRGIVTIISCAL